MRQSLLICIIALCVSACTFSAQQDTLQGQFNPPIIYKDWHSSNYTTRGGLNACGITSGNNGITVTLGKLQSGIDTVVASNRPMKPGTEFTVNVGSQSFVTSDKYFQPEVGRKLVDNLSKGDKAYLDWSESNGPSGGQRIHIQNVLLLDDFRNQLKQCRDSLAGTPAAN